MKLELGKGRAELKAETSASLRPVTLFVSFNPGGRNGSVQPKTDPRLKIKSKNKYVRLGRYNRWDARRGM